MCYKAIDYIVQTSDIRIDDQSMETLICIVCKHTHLVMLPSGVQATKTTNQAMVDEITQVLTPERNHSVQKSMTGNFKHL